jgi:hypothetical protein
MFTRAIFIRPDSELILKKINSDRLYAFNEVHLREEWSMVKHVLVGYQGVSTSSSPSLIPKDKFRLTVQICKSSFLL